jgi:hypothetical protein
MNYLLSSVLTDGFSVGRRIASGKTFLKDKAKRLSVEKITDFGRNYLLPSVSTDGIKRQMNKWL